MSVRILDEDWMVNRFNVPRHDMVPPQEAKGIGLRDLFSILRRRMWLILLIIGMLLFLIGVGVTSGLF